MTKERASEKPTFQGKSWMQVKLMVICQQIIKKAQYKELRDSISQMIHRYDQGLCAKTKGLLYHLTEKTHKKINVAQSLRNIEK